MKNNNVNLGEIVYCNLVVIHNKKKHKLDKIVYKNDNKLFYHKERLNEIKINEPVFIHEIDVLSRLGYESKLKI